MRNKTLYVRFVQEICIINNTQKYPFTVWWIIVTTTLVAAPGGSLQLGSTDGMHWCCIKIQYLGEFVTIETNNKQTVLVNKTFLLCIQFQQKILTLFHQDFDGLLYKYVWWQNTSRFYRNWRRKNNGHWMNRKVEFCQFQCFKIQSTPDILNFKWQTSIVHYIKSSI